jgi:hypothetical protein
VNIKEIAEKSDKQVERLFSGNVPSTTKLLNANNNVFAALVILECAKLVSVEDAGILRRVAAEVLKQ